MRVWEVDYQFMTARRSGSSSEIIGYLRYSAPGTNENFVNP